MKVQKRKMVVDAWPVSFLLACIERSSLPQEVVRGFDKGDIQVEKSAVRIKTMVGWVVCETHDWVVCDEKGYLYPCKEEDFRRLYEPAK